MRYRELKYNNTSYTKKSEIENILSKENLHWLIDSEIENANIEVKNKTLIWNGGDFYTGNWHYGIFKNGNFHGTWENGIFEDGNFKGKWKSGINKSSKVD